MQEGKPIRDQGQGLLPILSQATSGSQDTLSLSIEDCVSLGGTEASKMVSLEQTSSRQSRPKLFSQRGAWPQGFLTAMLLLN